MNQLSIRKIQIKKLFGHLTYTLPDDKEKDISKLLVIYGDNGSGKTTILKLLFYLISSRDRVGHKTKLAAIKFSALEVEFGNGIKIGAKRSRKLLGGFTYYISKGRKVLHSVVLTANSELSIDVRPGTRDDQKYQEILKYIRKLNISTFYLSDDRKTMNSISSSEEEDASDRDAAYEDDLVYEDVVLRRKKLARGRKLAVEPAVSKLFDWIRNKTIAGSKTGEKNSQVIFSDIFKSLNKVIQAGIINKTKDELLEEVIAIETEIVPFVNLGLIENFDSASIKNSIKSVKNNDQLNYINILVIPFLDSIKAKLKALEKLQLIITLFLDTINEYYSNKRVDFNLSVGFTLRHESKEDLRFDWLSSGEKQLLLLLINAITSAERATMFIIDEPEISLNVKWQRKLISTLLRLSADKNIQFIIATHSIELLSGNRDNVSKLTDLNERD